MTLHLEHVGCTGIPDQRNVMVERALHEIERVVGDFDCHRRILVTRILEQLRYDSAAQVPGSFW